MSSICTEVRWGRWAIWWSEAQHSNFGSQFEFGMHFFWAEPTHSKFTNRICVLFCKLSELKMFYALWNLNENSPYFARVESNEKFPAENCSRNCIGNFLTHGGQNIQLFWKGAWKWVISQELWQVFTPLEDQHCGMKWKSGRNISQWPFQLKFFCSRQARKLFWIFCWNMVTMKYSMWFVRSRPATSRFLLNLHGDKLQSSQVFTGLHRSGFVLAQRGWE